MTNKRRRNKIPAQLSGIKKKNINLCHQRNRTNPLQCMYYIKIRSKLTITFNYTFTGARYPMNRRKKKERKKYDIYSINFQSTLQVYHFPLIKSSKTNRRYSSLVHVSMKTRGHEVGKTLFFCVKLITFVFQLAYFLVGLRCLH